MARIKFLMEQLDISEVLQQGHIFNYKMYIFLSGAFLFLIRYDGTDFFSLLLSKNIIL